MFNPFRFRQPTGDGTAGQRQWSTKNILTAIAILIVIGGLAKVGSNYGFLPSSDFPRASGKRWQAVFLINNQVYFGHLKNFNRGYAVLDDVFYLQVNQELQPQTPGQQPQLNLIKLGGELHGPENRMFIPKKQILFWENLKLDAQVVRAIEDASKK